MPIRLPRTSRHCALSLERETPSAFSTRSAPRIGRLFQNSRRRSLTENASTTLLRGSTRRKAPSVSQRGIFRRFASRSGCSTMGRNSLIRACGSGSPGMRRIHPCSSKPKSHSELPGLNCCIYLDCGRSLCLVEHSRLYGTISPQHKRTGSPSQGLGIKSACPTPDRAGGIIPTTILEFHRYEIVRSSGGVYAGLRDYGYFFLPPVGT